MPAARVRSTSPIHWVLLLDNSNSMAKCASLVSEAIREFIGTLRAFVSGSSKSYCKISVLTFGNSVDAPLLENVREADVTADKLPTIFGNGGNTNVGPALDAARLLLQRSPSKSTDFQSFVLLLTDGQFTDADGTAPYRAAEALKHQILPQGQTQLLCLGFGDAKLAALQQMATKQDGLPLASVFKSVEELMQILPSIGSLSFQSGNTEEGVASINRSFIENYAHGGGL
jgi:Mg-chelatase subunit ChlD